MGDRQNSTSIAPASGTGRIARSASTLDPAADRALSGRAVAIGALLVILLAVATPINDWSLNGSYLFGAQLPLTVTVLALVFALAVNPLLGRRRLRPGEQVVILSMVLALGGVVSGGLMRVFPGVLAGPAHILPIDPNLAPYVAVEGGSSLLSPKLFVGMPARGAIQTADPEYRLVVDGFFNGLGNGPAVVGHRALVRWRDREGEHRAIAIGGEVAHELRGQPGYLDLVSPLGRALSGCHAGDVVQGPDGELTVLAVDPPGIPWHAWIGPIAHWLPLLAGGLLCCLAIASLVHQQWVERERLPFPIAQVTLAFLEAPPLGRRFAALYCNPAFWVAVAVPVVIFTSQGLMTWDLLPLSIPTEFNFRPAFASDPWWKVWDHDHLFNVHVYFSVIALAFFLTLDVSFSLWFFFVLTNLVVMVLRGWGVPVAYDHPMQAGTGGYAVECLFILWIGRQYYGRLLRVALFGGGEAELRALVPWVWVLLLSAAMMAAWLVAAGAQPGHATLLVLIFLGFILVLARLVAEAGVPYIGLPNPMTLNQTIFSLIGLQAPLSALAPLAYLGSTLLADQRELLLPYAMQSEYLAARVGIRRRHWRLSGLLVATLAIGGGIACATMIAQAYRGSGHADWYWIFNFVDFGLSPLAASWQSSGATMDTGGTWLSYGVGAALVALLGAGRLLVPGWPFHPLGYIASMPYPTRMIWFSFFIGWLAKVLIMRYGGPGLYLRLKPVALGLIAGEAIVAAVFLLVQAGLHLGGHEPATIPHFLPH
jgi:hypothetical protein